MCHQNCGQLRHGDVLLFPDPRKQEVTMRCQLADAASTLTWGRGARAFPPLYQLDRAAGTDRETFRSAPA